MEQATEILSGIDTDTRDWEKSIFLKRNDLMMTSSVNAPPLQDYSLSL